MSETQRSASGDDPAYPPALEAAERKLLEERRRAVKALPREPREADPPWAESSDSRSDALGVAVSGGGIRSATFGLGLFQALARHRLVRRIDYLSTVSGGGYFGSFLGALICRRQSVAEAERELADSGSWPLGWLRENGRYLAPTGGGDEVLAGAVLLRNWVALHVVLGIFFLAAFSVADLFRALLASYPGWPGFSAAPVATTVARGAVFVFWPSPYLWPPLATFLLAVFPLGWAYWFTQRSGDGSADRIAPLTGGLVAIASLVVVARAWPTGWSLESARPLLFPGFLFAGASLALLLWRVALASKSPGSARNRLARWLMASLVVTAALLTFGLVDSLGQSLYWSAWRAKAWHFGGAGAVLGSLGALAGAARRMVVAGAGAGRPRVALPAGLLAGVASLLVALVLLVFYSVIAHGFAWRWREPSSPLDVVAAFAALTATLVLSLLIGSTFAFLNLSSHHALYAARLTRAYLGASNKRRETRPEESRLTEPVEGDNSGMADYRPHASGGPVHLVNTTLNETIMGQSQVEQRDRKGLILAVGPAGLSAGVKHHALWQSQKDAESTISPVSIPGKDPSKAGDAFHLFGAKGGEPHPVESLDLGAWVAISGAAFSTGLGARTSLGMSLLLGLSNIRLGYWWDSHVDPDARKRTKPRGAGWLAEKINVVFPVQSYLLQELLARFYGPARRRWYLSDGGHFENTAAYELIRRRVPTILVSDAGQDEGYSFADMAGLVRKARTDFGAEIRFWTKEDLDRAFDHPLRGHLGTLEDLRPCRELDHGPAASSTLWSGAHLALASVTYRGGARSLLILVKPSLTGDEPLDVLEYKASHTPFPQQTTADQFFDEAQWESYRKLGEHIGEVLTPANLDRLRSAASATGSSA